MTIIPQSNISIITTSAAVVSMPLNVTHAPHDPLRLLVRAANRMTVQARRFASALKRVHRELERQGLGAELFEAATDGSTS